MQVQFCRSTNFFFVLLVSCTTSFIAQNILSAP